MEASEANEGLIEQAAQESGEQPNAAELASGDGTIPAVESGTTEPEPSPAFDHVTAVLPLKQSTAGGSGAFLVRADDGRRYWCKAANNGQSARVPVNEQIVARLARLVGVEVCEPCLVRIPDDLVGWEFRPGLQLEAGWAHGSLAVKDAIETRTLAHRGDDDNARRQAGFFVVFDWLHGGDAQWLYSTSESNAYYQHDNGHYFPNPPEWTPALLQAAVGQPNPLGNDSAGLDPDELNRLADALEALSREEITEALANKSNISAIWRVDETDVEAVIDFAYARRPEVAARTRAL